MYFANDIVYNNNICTQCHVYKYISINEMKQLIKKVFFKHLVA